MSAVLDLAPSHLIFIVRIVENVLCIHTSNLVTTCSPRLRRGEVLGKKVPVTCLARRCAMMQGRIRLARTVYQQG
jgi:hypothetical protein